MKKTVGKHYLSSILIGTFLFACSGNTEKVPTNTENTATPKEEGKKTPTPSEAPKTTKEGDKIQTSLGEVTITPIMHGSVLLSIAGKSVYVDPWSKKDLSDFPKADLILITDIHQDHLDTKAIEMLKGDKTEIVAPKAVADTVKEAKVLKNGEDLTILDMKIEAVPMYNLVRGPEEGKLFHDKGRGNGYIVTIGDKRFYFSGDTECIPEMQALENIDVAFVCMNLPYTMTPKEAAGCVKKFKPQIVYPYHYRDSNLDEFSAELAKEEGIEIRKKEWY